MRIWLNAKPEKRLTSLYSILKRVPEIIEHVYLDFCSRNPSSEAFIDSRLDVRQKTNAIQSESNLDVVACGDLVSMFIVESNAVKAVIEKHLLAATC